MTTTTEKKCTKCGEFKLLECFYNDKHTRDGLWSRCKVCVRESQKKYHQDNKEAILGYKKKHYQDNKEAITKKRKEYRQENKEAVAEYHKKRYQDNKEVIKRVSKKYHQENREAISKKRKEYRQKYPDKNNAASAKSRATKLNATPPWLTDRHHKDMRNIYAKSVRKSKRDGVKYHVDHIVPLRGKNVSGLHVPWNLQILTAEENLSKNNSHSDWD